ncbi:MAG: sialate O-acetylesterase [Rubripirellula sp.]|nr:sialate O-acetylesterase [Rubripirellula sp.]
MMQIDAPITAARSFERLPAITFYLQTGYPPPMLRFLFVLACAVAATTWSPASAAEAVKVFVLAGQSNMQGHGKVNAEPRANDGKGSLEWLARNPKTAHKYGSLVNAAGDWKKRSDVQIVYLDRKGDLTPGYGHREGYIGPELGFGQVIGDAFESPVLLIKIAWGGKSLGKDFRPPSAGGEVGEYYQELLRLTQATLRDAKTLFPGYSDRTFELAGFGWHQGWNDRVNQAFNDEYEQNMAYFIKDIRKALDVPSMPFVIAETGMSGWDEKHPRAVSLMKAQKAVAQKKEFVGNVKFVGTKDFYRPKEVSPSGQAYHWNSNAETYYLIGEGMGQAMLQLISFKQ